MARPIFRTLQPGALDKGRPGRPWTSLLSDCKGCRTVNSSEILPKIIENKAKSWNYNIKIDTSECKFYKKLQKRLEKAFLMQKSSIFKRLSLNCGKIFVGLEFLSDSKIGLDVPEQLAAQRA